MELMDNELGYGEDADNYNHFLSQYKDSFNTQLWNGKEYRHPDYKELTDDRVHALAVVSGIADSDKYNAIANVFATQKHASPYMEMYVFEAMMLMRMEEEAIARHSERFSPMVNNPDFTTLFELWEHGSGWTVNHGWSGGGLAIVCKYLCGISPLKPGFKEFAISPQPGNVNKAKVLVPTIRGNIKSEFNIKDNKFIQYLIVPEGTIATYTLPIGNYKWIKLIGKNTVKHKVFLQDGIYIIEAVK